MTIMLVPLIGLLIPAMRITPSIYPWLVRRRIFHWYRELRKVEGAWARTPRPSSCTQKMSDLDHIDEGIRTSANPAEFLRPALSIARAYRRGAPTRCRHQAGTA